ncbi:MAG: HesA/MoeB/ThiF family protein [Muribaculaceae bacterium]|nr:HesA/MoeB/ThiF family protein [Muribaculaceae bacterium]
MRYARQIAIPGFGKDGQDKLSKAKVFIIGCGALGSMAAMQLAGAGIATIGIADYDTIDISNLQRQFFFTTAEAGRKKVEVLAERMKLLNPLVEVRVHDEFITPDKARKIIPEYDFIIDASDNPDSKRMTGIVTKEMGKPCCIAGVRDFSGQVLTMLPSDPRFEEFFGNVSNPDVLPCSLSGVIGPAAAVAASIQASETIKYFSQVGEILSGRLIIFDLLSNSFNRLSLI